MELKQITKQLSVMKNSKNLQVISHKDDGTDEGFEISIYRKGELLVNAKPESQIGIFTSLREDLKMSKNMVNQMTRMMIDKDWTQERFMGAYNYVLENCTFYPPKLAEFLSYDKKVRFNTYSEICDKTNQYTPIYYKKVKEPLYITKREQEQFNFPEWKEEYRQGIKKYWTNPETKETIEV